MPARAFFFWSFFDFLFCANNDLFVKKRRLFLDLYLEENVKRKQSIARRAAGTGGGKYGAADNNILYRVGGRWFEPLDQHLKSFFSLFFYFIFPIFHHKLQ